LVAEPESTTEPTTTPEEDTSTDAPTVTPSLLFEFPEYTLPALQQEDSPQSMALTWMLSDPNVSSYSVERQMQRFALATFYYTTNGDAWTLNTNWLKTDTDNDVHECFWYSQVPVCNALQEYIVIELNDNNLVGELPPELAMLTSLTELHLQKNQLQGGIPTEIATDLAETMIALDLQDNLMTEVFPTELGLMTNLNYLWLNSTRDANSSGTLFAPIPTEVAFLTNLQEMHLSNNKLSGTIPSEIALLSQLDWITLRGNILSGSIPTELPLLPSLTWLDLAENNLVGEIPIEIGNLNDTLRILQLESNDLTGLIPFEMNRLTNVEIVLLHDNMFTGNVPVGLCYFQRIGKIDSISIDCEEVECSCRCDCAGDSVLESSSFQPEFDVASITAFPESITETATSSPIVEESNTTVPDAAVYPTETVDLNTTVVTPEATLEPAVDLNKTIVAREDTLEPTVNVNTTAVVPIETTTAGSDFAEADTTFALENNSTSAVASNTTNTTISS